MSSRTSSARSAFKNQVGHSDNVDSGEPATASTSTEDAKKTSDKNDQDINDDEGSEHSDSVSKGDEDDEFKDTDLIIADGSGDDDSWSCVKTSFTTCNCISWIIWLVIIGLTVWCIAGRSEEFLSGTSVISISFLAVSFYGYLLCVIGYILVVRDSFYISGAYLIMLILLTCTQGGLILGAWVLYPQPIGMVDQAWTELADELREMASKQLECCGLTNYTDTYPSAATVPDACKDSNDVIYTDGCGEAILTFHSSGSGLTLLLVVTSIIAFIQVMLICFTIAYFKSLRTKIVTSDEDLYSMHNGSVRGLRNSRIVPIIMISDEDEVKDTEPPASRQNVTVGIGSSDNLDNLDPDEKGNEALISVAGLMLSG